MKNIQVVLSVIWLLLSSCKKTESEYKLDTIKDIRQLLGKNKLSEQQLVKYFFEKSRKNNYRSEPFVTIIDEQTITYPLPKGLLTGVPVAIKDNLHVKNISTTAGSKVFANWQAAKDAIVVERIRKAGGVIVGKTQMDQMAMGVTSTNSSFGSSRNSFSHLFPAGGSSGGSAIAVAEGLVPVAIGTDTGGSIRIPSSLQGIFGLKTSFGFIPNRGLVFLSRFRDVIGPMSKNLDDLEIMLKVISDTKNIPKFEQSLVAGKTFYVPREFFDHCDEHIRNLFSNVVRGLEAKGASVDFIKIWPSVKKFERMGKLSIAIEWQRILDDVLTKAKVGKPVAKLPFDPAVKYLYEKSSELKEYYSLEKFSQEFANFQKAFLRKYKDVDYFIMPTLPYFPPKISQLETPMQRRKILIDYTNQNRIASLIGLPALNIPMGRGPHDIPAGFQIVGKYGKDFELIQLAKEMGYRAIDL